MKNNVFTLVYFSLSIFLIGCNLSSSNSSSNNNATAEYQFTERLTLYTGGKPMMCSVTTNDYSGTAGLCHRDLFDVNGKTITTQSSIGDFKLKMGVSYELVVDRYDYIEPDEDSSSYFLKLVEVKSEQQDELGSRYSYEDLHLYSDIFYKVAEGVFGSGHYQFLCGPKTDCDTLVNMANSGGIINVEFTLLATEESGQAAIFLTDWH